MADTLLIDLFKKAGSIVFQVAEQELNLLVGVDEEVQKLQLKDKIHLRRLVLSFGGTPFPFRHEEEFLNEKSRMENDVKVLNAFEPPPNLQYLEIKYYHGNTIYPNSMMSCTTLKKLELGFCEYLEHLPSLGQLPFLEELVIAWLHKVKKVGDEFLGIEDSKNKKDYNIIFPNLKSLQFISLLSWEEWIEMEGTGEEEEEENDNGIVTNPIIMPRLQYFRICDCDKLKSLPDYLLTAPLLKELNICLVELLKERYERGIGENWHKISHISNIQLDNVYVQRDGEPQFDSETPNQPNVFDDDQNNACTIS